MSFSWLSFDSKETMNFSYSCSSDSDSSSDSDNGRRAGGGGWVGGWASGAGRMRQARNEFGGGRPRAHLDEVVAAVRLRVADERIQRLSQLVVQPAARRARRASGLRAAGGRDCAGAASTGRVAHLRLYSSSSCPYSADRSACAMRCDTMKSASMASRLCCETCAQTQLRREPLASDGRYVSQHSAQQAAPLVCE